MRKTVVLPCMLLALAAPLVRAEDDYIDAGLLGQADLFKFWQLQLPLGPGESVRDAYLVDDQLYFGTDKGFVYAVDAYTGAIRWGSTYTRGGYRLGRPAHIGLATAIVTPPEVIYFDREYGNALRRYDWSFPAGTPGVSDGERLYVGGLDRRIYAFGAENGHELWKAATDSQLASLPILMGQYLYYVADSGTVYACEAATKTFFWINRAIGPVSADLIGDENGVYVASRDRSLYLLDPTYGRSRWRVRLSGPLSEPPVLTHETAYQYSPNDGLVAINAIDVNLDNRITWTFPRGRHLLTVDEHAAYALTSDEHLAVLRKKDGKLLHDIPMPGFSIPVSATDQTVVFVVSPDGRLFCARKHGVPVVRPEQVQDALRSKQQKNDDAIASAEKTEEKPATGDESTDYLESSREGAPVGGKSKVSKQFRENSGTP